MPEGGRIIASPAWGLAGHPTLRLCGASRRAGVAGASLAQELGPGDPGEHVSAGVVDTDALKYFPNRESCWQTTPPRAGRSGTAPETWPGVYLLCLPRRP